MAVSEDRKLWLKDAGERLAWTFVQAFAASIALAGAFGLDSLQAAAIAGLSAAISYFKSTLAALQPNTISPASTLPSGPDSPAVIDGDQVSVGIADADGNLVAVLKGSRPQ